jgi:hypothetical protein
MASERWTLKHREPGDREGGTPDQAERRHQQRQRDRDERGGGQRNGGAHGVLLVAADVGVGLCIWKLNDMIQIS